MKLDKTKKRLIKSKQKKQTKGKKAQEAHRYREHRFSHTETHISTLQETVIYAQKIYKVKEENEKESPDSAF